MGLPELFCWTRFGVEAGEPVESIFARKEQERIQNKGIFLWGVGNAVGPSISEFVRLAQSPEVLFSPIKSPPRERDVAPETVVAWTAGVDLNGRPFELPKHSLVTSRYEPNGVRHFHYALVCCASKRLTDSKPDSEKIAIGALRNLLSGRPVGASQVTAIVRAGRVANNNSAHYDVVIRVTLAFPYFIRLHGPVALPNHAASGPRDIKNLSNTLSWVKRQVPIVPQQLRLSDR